MRRLAYRRRGQNLNYQDLSKHITKLKKTSKYIWLQEVPAGILVQALRDLDNAFERFFKKIAKYPRFKKRRNTQAIRFQIDQRCIVNNYMAGKKLKLTKLGELKIKWSKIPSGTPKMVTLTKTASRKYFVSFSCEENISPKAKTYQEVGVDVGIKDVIVTVNNYYSGAPRNFYKYARKLKPSPVSWPEKPNGQIAIARKPLQ